jgi:hypothetical protein
MDLSGYLTHKIMVLINKNLNDYIDILICYKNDTTVVWSCIFLKKMLHSVPHVADHHLLTHSPIESAIVYDVDTCI